MLKKPLKGKTILDTLHRGAVYTCIGVTLWGTAMLGERFYRFFTVTKPAREEEQLKMLQEGVQDKAPIIKS